MALSHKGFPNQFTPRLIGEDSLFQACARRFAMAAFAQPLGPSMTEFRFMGLVQLGNLGISEATVMLEPSLRKTAPKLLHLQAQGEGDARMPVAPFDHVI